MTRPSEPGKLPGMLRPLPPVRSFSPGLTTLEVLVILLVVAGGLFVARFAAEAWKRGKERSQCILNIRNAQTAGRSFQGMNQVAVGANLDWSKIIGPGQFLTDPPVCPGGGTYHLAAKAPPVGSLFMTCSLATSLNHQPATTKGW